jgi:CheY-like chemotaxis protein
MKKNLRLLIADDDADDRMFFIDTVKEIDDSIECCVAKDGLHALEVLNDSAFDLPDYIFMDLRMPRFNGKRCLAELKKNERLKHIPVLIYTTSRDVNESIELKSMGAAHFISKPNNPEEIYYILTVVLEEQIAQRGNNQSF